MDTEKSELERVSLQRTEAFPPITAPLTGAVNRGLMVASTIVTLSCVAMVSMILFFQKENQSATILAVLGLAVPIHQYLNSWMVRDGNALALKNNHAMNSELQEVKKTIASREFLSGAAWTQETEQRKAQEAMQATIDQLRKALDAQATTIATLVEASKPTIVTGEK